MRLDRLLGLLDDLDLGRVGGAAHRVELVLLARVQRVERAARRAPVSACVPAETTFAVARHS